MSKVVGKVPRGFTRYYVLYLLSERPMTGKELIDEAETRSEGGWSPSPGLIYPLLGRLLEDKLVKELEGGRFIITLKGEEALKNYSNLQDQLESQLNLIRKMGVSMFTASKFIVDEAVNRIKTVSDNMINRAEASTIDLQQRFKVRYKEFLERELKRLEESEM